MCPIFREGKHLYEIQDGVSHKQFVEKFNIPIPWRIMKLDSATRARAYSPGIKQEAMSIGQTEIEEGFPTTDIGFLSHKKILRRNSQ